VNHGPIIFLGILACVMASWLGSVVAPHFQFGDLDLVTIEETGQTYPVARSGEALQGADVYRANGCNYCHTQQVRPGNEGSDLARGWGRRRTVARDYLRDEPILLGQVRFGPDLANLGIRETNAIPLLQKLYNPRILIPGSTMPRYPFLFEERPLKPGAAPSSDALPLPPSFAPAGREVFPRPEALSLVAYLRGLHSDPIFFEVFPTPPPGKATNRLASASGSTNAPAAPATSGVPPTNPPAAK